MKKVKPANDIYDRMAKTRHRRAIVEAQREGHGLTESLRKLERQNPSGRACSDCHRYNCRQGAEQYDVEKGEWVRYGAIRRRGSLTFLRHLMASLAVPPPPLRGERFD